MTDLQDIEWSVSVDHVGVNRTPHYTLTCTTLNPDPIGPTEVERVPITRSDLNELLAVERLRDPELLDTTARTIVAAYLAEQ